MEDIKKLIIRCYGSVDLIFAGHANEIKSAQEALNAALNKELGFQEYVNLHLSYLKSKGVAADHLIEQEERIKDLTSYFQFD